MVTTANPPADIAPTADDPLDDDDDSADSDTAMLAPTKRHKYTGDDVEAAEAFANEHFISSDSAYARYKFMLPPV